MPSRKLDPDTATVIALTADAHNLAMKGGNISEAVAYLARAASGRGDLLAQACAHHGGGFAGDPWGHRYSALAAGLLQRAGADTGDLADQIEVIRRRVAPARHPSARPAQGQGWPELRNMNWPDVPDIPQIPFLETPIPVGVRLLWTTGEEWAEGVAIRLNHRYAHVRIDDPRLPGGLVWLGRASITPTEE